MSASDPDLHPGAATARLQAVADTRRPGAEKTRLTDAIALIDSSPLPTGQALVTGPPEDLTAALAAAAQATEEISAVYASANRPPLLVASRWLALTARGLVQSVVETSADPTDQRAVDTLAALGAADRTLAQGDLSGASHDYADANAIYLGPPTTGA